MKPANCANCKSTCSGLFCSIACAAERYAILHEALAALEDEVRWLRKKYLL